MAIETGLLEQAFARAESTYSDNTYVSSIVAADAFLHRRLAVRGKHNRVPSPEKRGTPGRAVSLPRRKTAEWTCEAAWQPSGVLGTPSDIGMLLKATFGTQTSPALSTTIASGPTTTGATLTSGAGLAVGDCVVVTMPAGHREATRLKTVAGAVVTWDALSIAPAVSAAVVSGNNYKLTTALPDSLAILKAYTAGTKQEVVQGAVVNELTLNFPGSEEVVATFSGPAARYRRTGASVPGSQTLAGEPVASFNGNEYLDANAFLMTNLKVMLNNNQGLRNLEIGTEYATGRYRNTFRECRVEATFYFEDARIQDAAEAITRHVLRHVTNNVNGSMVGVVCPKVEWEIPDVPDSGDGPLIITATGTAYETSGNDEIFVFEA
jgi:hypothetical protein